MGRRTYVRRPIAFDFVLTARSTSFGLFKFSLIVNYNSTAV